MYSLQLQTPAIHPYYDLQDPLINQIVVPSQILDLHLLRKLFESYEKNRTFAICIHGLTESPGILNRRRDRDPIVHGNLSVLILNLRADTNYVVPLFQALKLPNIHRLEVQIDIPLDTTYSNRFRYSGTVVDNFSSNGFVQLLRQPYMVEVSIWDAPLRKGFTPYLTALNLNRSASVLASGGF